jgi:hypothetical protein
VPTLFKGLLKHFIFLTAGLKSKSSAELELKVNKLQQEIKDFHEKMSPALTKVLALYKQGDTRQINREFIKSCKKLLQKCSFKPQ